MSDQLLYQVSNEGQGVAEPFIQKSVVYIIDQNNGNYSSSQVQIDTSSLSNSGKWASYSEALLQVPLIQTLTPVTGGTFTGWGAAPAQFASGFKSGFWNLIHSFSVEYNNSQVIQLCPYQNMYTSFKMVTSLSQDDAEKLGPSIGFFKDTPDSWEWNTDVSVSGKGSSNNRDAGIDMLYPGMGALTGTNKGAILSSNTTITTISQTLGGPFTGGLLNIAYPSYADSLTTTSLTTTANRGFYKRQKLIAMDPAATLYSGLLVPDTLKTMSMNYYKSGASNDDAKAKVWYYIASIRLKDLHDFFAQLPLIRGAYMRFIINFNTGAAKIAVTKTTPSATVPVASTLTQSQLQLIGGTFPAMIASAAPGQGAFDLMSTVTTGGEVSLAVTIAKQTPSEFFNATDTTPYSHNLLSVRLFVPLYTMNPIAEAAYLEANPTKTIIYRDILNYQVAGVAKNGSVNQLLTNGVVNPKAILLVPIFSSDTTYGNAISYAAHQSAFASEPATTSPLCRVNNLNILLAGVTVFQQNIIFGWSQFVDEIQHANAINGSQTTGLNSGLLSEYDWNQNYCYIYADLSRRIASENAIPKSLQVLFTSLSGRTVDFYCFIELERSLQISLLNGQLVA